MCLHNAITRGAPASIKVEPDETNGLRQTCHIMVDKVTTVSREKLGRPIGDLGTGVMVQLDRALLVFMGLAGPSPSRER